jgi:Domain of unknown function (DUF4190)/Septum formation
MRFNPPPGWPPPPADFVPPPGWQPDPSWPPPPPDWRLWVDDQPIPGARPWPAAPPPGYGPTASPSGPAAAYSHGHPGRPGVPHDPASQPPAKAKTSGWAIASFVLGLLTIVLLSVIFGIVALQRIKRLGQRGRGLAIAGLALSGVWLVVIVIAVVLSNLGSASRSPATGKITNGGNLSAFSLATGDCFNNPAGATSLESVAAIPCGQAHNAQIYAKFNLSGSIVSYPGTTTLTRLATNGCNARIAVLDKSKITDSMTIRFLFPQENSWIAGQRTVACMIANSAANVTSSVLNP